MERFSIAKATMGTLQQTVIDGYGPAAWSLLSDEASTAAKIRVAIGPAIAGGDAIISDMPFEQLNLTMASARFADSCEECVLVARMVHWLIRRPDVFPMITAHRGYALASRCLICIALFKKAMESRQRRGYPSVAFYRGAGIQAARIGDMEDIAEHFDQWSAFVGEHLAV